MYLDFEGKSLDVGKVLFILVLFNILIFFMVLFIFFCIIFIIVSVSIKRLMRFLLFEETEGFADKNKILIYSIGIDIIDLDGVIGIEVGILLVYIGKCISWKRVL